MYLRTSNPGHLLIKAVSTLSKSSKTSVCLTYSQKLQEKLSCTTTRHNIPKHKEQPNLPQRKQKEEAKDFTLTSKLTEDGKTFSNLRVAGYK